MRISYGYNCSGELSTLPGCTQVVVSHGVFVNPAFRKQGWGQEALNAREELMREKGYNYALCTVESTNGAQIHILTKFRWKELDRFISSKTGHEVILFGKRL